MKPFFLSLLAAGALTACAQSQSAPIISIENHLDIPRSCEMVEVDGTKLLKQYPAEEGKFFAITDAAARPVAYDIVGSSIFFQATVGANASADYFVVPSDTLPAFAAITSARVYPERNDDFSWENDLVAFRAYGPTTQKNKEKAFGYDIFLKHPSPHPMLEILYERQCNPANWAKADSLGKIDKKLRQDWLDGYVSYHIDHGLGMDCYAVGATLGDGVAAIFSNDSIRFPWCYEKATVLSLTPRRVQFQLDFAPRAIGADSAVVEHRIITLDAGEHLNHTTLWYDGLTAPQTIVAGFPLRDDSPTYTDSSTGIVAYADPTQGPDNGRAQLGLIIPGGADSTFTAQGHVLAAKSLQPGQAYHYWWGFSWDRADIPSMEAWIEYLVEKERRLASPLTATVK